MMRLLFLCALLLLPAATVLSEDIEASGNDDQDDEDIYNDTVRNNLGSAGSVIDKTTGADTTEQLTVVVIVVAVTVLALSVAAIVAIMLVRRHMHRRRQGIYSVPTEQHHKAAV
ncbi:uncharacterized protein ACB058_019633 [Synchiropus picturatus]